MGFRFSWDDKTVGTSILLAQVDAERRATYMSAVEQYCSDIQVFVGQIIFYFNPKLPFFKFWVWRTLLKSNKKVLYTPARLLYLDEWGPIRYAMNSASICLMASDFTRYLFRKLISIIISNVQAMFTQPSDFTTGLKVKLTTYSGLNQTDTVTWSVTVKSTREDHTTAPRLVRKTCRKFAITRLHLKKMIIQQIGISIRQNFAFLVGCSIVCNNTALFYGMKTLSIVHWGAVVGGPDRHDGYKDDRLYYKQVSLWLISSSMKLFCGAEVQLYVSTGVMNICSHQTLVVRSDCTNCAFIKLDIMSSEVNFCF